MRKVWLWLINEEGADVVAFVKILSPDLGMGLRKKTLQTRLQSRASNPSLLEH